MRIVLARWMLDWYISVVGGEEEQEEAGLKA